MGYLPTFNSIIYINDLDNLSSQNACFDAIEDISEDLPIAPQVSIGIDSPIEKDTAISFYSNVYDPDSSIFSYEWDFGDSTTSSLPNPYHVYTDAASHPYTVTQYRQSRLCFARGYVRAWRKHLTRNNEFCG